MRRVCLLMSTLLISLVLLGGVAAAFQPTPVGLFDGTGDVGAVKHEGAVVYNPVQQTYTISGAGTNIWAHHDEFQFAWKEIAGDFILTADMELQGEGVDPHRKIGWMIRTSLEDDSAYVDVAVHGDGLTSMQYRADKGGDTEELRSTVKAPNVVQLERRAGRFYMSVAKRGEAFTVSELVTVELPFKVYVGLFVCSHNADEVETARFSNVRITRPAPFGLKQYSQYIGSRLEVMDVTTGHRRVLHTVADSLQAPNWSRDGKALIYNRNGKLYRFDLASKAIEEINTDFADNNNNDHVISTDGKRIAISHHSKDHNGDSHIYVLPIEGGTPRLVTKRGPSYLHGWSPDDQWLVYTGGRDGGWDIYKTRADGSGDEVRLTTHGSLQDGSEFAPDGNRIFYTSSQTGAMEVWDMKPDGSDHRQITNDRMNSWFPHPSPDGSKIVILSFGSELAANDHPFYEPVTLRLIDMENVAKGEVKPKIIAYLYGGQGTINVPSWSPDGKSIAFVSNSIIESEE